MARGLTDREFSTVSRTSESTKLDEKQQTNKGQPSWMLLLLSVSGSAAAAAAVGGVCALLYPVIGELHAERVRRDDGTEERMLGFWSILVFSLLAFIICSIFSLILTYLNEYRPGMAFPTLRLPSEMPPHSGDVSGYDTYWNYWIAVFNGVMAMVAVIWTLS